MGFVYFIGLFVLAAVCNTITGTDGFHFQDIMTWLTCMHVLKAVRPNPIDYIHTDEILMVTDCYYTCHTFRLAFEVNL